MSDLTKEIDRLNSTLKEALNRQAVTSEILRVINNSPTSGQPVFDAIVQAGLTLFPDAAISIALPVGDEVHAMAVAEASPARADAWRGRFRKSARSRRGKLGTLAGRPYAHQPRLGG